MSSPWETVRLNGIDGMKKAFAIICMAAAVAGCSRKPCGDGLPAEPADLASTLTGTMSDYSLSAGNTYPAVALPWGMNFWTPQTGRNGDGWTYRYDAHTIRGIKQTHQPSPWINDYGQFSIMPVKDASKADEDSRASWFSHKTETARPYYYKVYLADHDVTAEVAPTERAAVMRFTFPENELSGIVTDAFDSGSFIRVMPDKRTIEGYTTRNSGGVPSNFHNWFVIKFDKEIESFDIYDGDCRTEGYEVHGGHAIATVKFRTARGERVTVRTASSFISMQQAYTNLKEVEGKDFDTVREEARRRWNDVLGRIIVSGGSPEQYRTFYSCLYRCLLFPRKFYECAEDGKIMHYSPFNGRICEGKLYTDSGFWDTFRALFPLLNLVYPSISEEIEEGYANVALENEFLPEWASPGHRDCMVGNNSASVVADAVVKDICKTGTEDLYRAIVHATGHVHPEVSSTGRLGHEYYNTIGYVPSDAGIRESVARTLEYAYDDWCILKLAEKLGRPREELDRWAGRAMNYKNVFDPETGLMRGRRADGTFDVPFNPYKWGDAFTEGNAWHYTWSVFHDMAGLAELMGGRKAFSAMLDSVFSAPPVYDDSYYGVRIHEITEMQVADMGNYAHGNQPAQHIAYLYDYVQEPWKAQYWVREIMDRLYSATPDGYCGDEDNGQTSAWYVFSALGFYPVCPVSDQYCIGSPLFREAKIRLENGRTITIRAKDNAPDRRYVHSLKIDGRRYDKNYIEYGTLLKGAELDFSMSEKAFEKRGVSDEAIPYSFSDELAGKYKKR